MMLESICKNCGEVITNTGGKKYQWTHADADQTTCHDATPSCSLNKALDTLAIVIGPELMPEHPPDVSFDAVVAGIKALKGTKKLSGTRTRKEWEEYLLCSPTLAEFSRRLDEYDASRA